MSETNNKASLDEPDKFEQVLEELQIDEKPELYDYPKEADLIDESMFADLLPNMVLNEQKQAADEEECIVEDKVLLDVYDEILDNCRKDREDIDEVLTDFKNMVFNDGESSSATKEAVVNLLKAKSDISDKMSKVADLMTRIKLKSKDTFPRFLNAHQHNNVKIESSGSSRRDLLQRLESNKKDKKK